MTQQYAPAQLEVWAGLGPWSYRSQEHDDWGIVRTGRYIVCQARDHQFMDDGYLNLCREEKRDPHEIPARLIAAAPDLARLVLERDAEIARLKEAGEKLALWAYEEVGADPELTPGLHDMLNLTGHEGNQ